MTLVDWSKPFENNGHYTYCRAHKQWEAYVLGGTHAPVMFHFWKPKHKPFKDDNPLGPMPIKA